MTIAEQELCVARAQRDQAFACAALSILIALALVLSNLGPEPKTENARKAVGEHKLALADLQLVLQRNTAELAQDNIAIGMLRRASRP